MYNVHAGCHIYTVHVCTCTCIYNVFAGDMQKLLEEREKALKTSSDEVAGIKTQYDKTLRMKNVSIILLFQYYVHVHVQLHVCTCMYVCTCTCILVHVLFRHTRTCIYNVHAHVQCTCTYMYILCACTCTLYMYMYIVYMDQPISLYIIIRIVSKLLEG